MLKTTIKTFAAAVVAISCLTVSAEAGQKRSGHNSGHAMKAAHGNANHHSGFAIGAASVFAAGSSYHAIGYAYPAGKGCGPTYTYVTRPVAKVVPLARAVVVRSSPVCVCD